jgi:hypothetical protein
VSSCRVCGQCNHQPLEQFGGQTGSFGADSWHFEHTQGPPTQTLGRSFLPLPSVSRVSTHLVIITIILITTHRFLSNKKPPAHTPCFHDTAVLPVLC